MKKLFLVLIYITSMPLFCAEGREQPTEGIIKINSKAFRVPKEVFDYYSCVHKAALHTKKENVILKKTLEEAHQREQLLLQKNKELQNQLSKSQEYAQALKKENAWHREKDTPEKSKTPRPEVIKKVHRDLIHKSHSFESLKDLVIHEDKATAEDDINEK